MKKFWENRKVLVTGGTGFIGKHLVAALRELGADVTVFSGNVSHCKEVSTAINGIDIVYHLAAQSLVEAGERSPLGTYKTNVMGTLNVLESARKNKVRRIVVASTSQVYGNNPDIPYLETYPPRPSRPYETSKACADLIAQSYFSFYGLSVFIARMVNTYGQRDFNFSRVVPYVVKSILEGRDIEIYGGKSVREYLSVKDAISAYMLLGQASIKGEDNGIFNFGSGCAINVVDLAKLILRISKVRGLKVVVTEGKRNGEVLEQRVSSQKSLDELNWEPTYSLEEGLMETFEWYKNYFAKPK